jgi:hypothetical protein
MQQPRQQHYHFTYTALPETIFAGHAPSMLLDTYPDGLVSLLHRLWDSLGDQLPPEERAPGAGLTVTAHRLGGKIIVLLIHLPPPERMLECYFSAIAFTSAVRYFTLGRGVGDDLPDVVPSTTLREVSRDGTNARLGTDIAPSADAMLERLCAVLKLPNQVEAISTSEVRKPSAGSSNVVILAILMVLGIAFGIGGIIWKNRHDQSMQEQRAPLLRELTALDQELDELTKRREAMGQQMHELIENIKVQKTEKEKDQSRLDLSTLRYHSKVIAEKISSLEKQKLDLAKRLSELR